MRRIEELVDYDRIEEILLVSNTPLYLYKHMVEDESVRTLAEHFSAKELSSLSRKYLAKAGVDRVATLTVYAIIFAMAHKEYDEAKTFFDHLEDIGIKWPKNIKDIYTARVRSETIQLMNGVFVTPPTSENHSVASQDTPKESKSMRRGK